MKLKTSELIGSALDLAVAVAWNVELDEQGMPVWFDSDGKDAARAPFLPSSHKEHGQPVIDQFSINVMRVVEDGRQSFEAFFDDGMGGADGTGPTELTAAMRALAVRRFGEYFPVPAAAQRRFLRLQAVWDNTPRHKQYLAGKAWWPHTGCRVVHLERGRVFRPVLLDDLTEQEIEDHFPPSLRGIRPTVTKMAEDIKQGDIIRVPGESACFVTVAALRHGTENPRHLSVTCEDGHPALLFTRTEPVDVVAGALAD